MNDNTYYKSCSKCGRPQTFCKGDCCGEQHKGCGCQEYGPKVGGCIRQISPKCPYKAVIPSVTVDTAENLKDLADCFVHVSDINTTFYIDDKHRIITTWAGPVEYNNYDLETNPLGLRSQFLIDFANERGAYYDKTGAYEVFSFGDNSNDEVEVDVSVGSILDGNWWPAGFTYGPLIDTRLDETYRYDTRIMGYNVTDAITITRHDTSEELSVENLYNLIESGKSVVVNGLPLVEAAQNASGDIVSENIYGVAKKARFTLLNDEDPGEGFIKKVTYGGIILGGRYPLTFRISKYFPESPSEPSIFNVELDIAKSITSLR